jgi:predicted lipid-binding transport protein (Tim44 family)
MTSDPESRSEPAGRPVTLTPLPPGLWLVLGGGMIAALGPLFGFLVGSMVGSTDADLQPVFLYLMIGIIIGGLGVVMMILGARRLLRQRRLDQEQEERLTPGPGEPVTDSSAPPPAR